MLYTYECNNSACKKEIEKVEAFNMIELEYKKIINSLMKNDEGYSFDETDIDFFLKYYFLQKKPKILNHRGLIVQNVEIKPK